MDERLKQELDHGKTALKIGDVIKGADNWRILPLFTQEVRIGQNAEKSGFDFKLDQTPSSNDRERGLSEKFFIVANKTKDTYLTGMDATNITALESTGSGIPVENGLRIVFALHDDPAKASTHRANLVSGGSLSGDTKATAFYVHTETPEKVGHRELQFSDFVPNT